MIAAHIKTCTQINCWSTDAEKIHIKQNVKKKRSAYYKDINCIKLKHFLLKHWMLFCKFTYLICFWFWAMPHLQQQQTFSVRTWYENWFQYTFTEQSGPCNKLVKEHNHGTYLFLCKNLTVLRYIKIHKEQLCPVIQPS